MSTDTPLTTDAVLRIYSEADRSQPQHWVIGLNVLWQLRLLRYGYGDFLVSLYEPRLLGLRWHISDTEPDALYLESDATVLPAHTFNVCITYMVSDKAQYVASATGQIAVVVQHRLESAARSWDANRPYTTQHYRTTSHHDPLRCLTEYQAYYAVTFPATHRIIEDVPCSALPLT